MAQHLCIVFQIKHCRFRSVTRDRECDRSVVDPGICILGLSTALRNSAIEFLKFGFSRLMSLVDLVLSAQQPAHSHRLVGSIK